MLTETGRIVALDGTGAWVETTRSGSCGKCAARSGCGHGLLSSIGHEPALVLALRNGGSPSDLALHDEVRIALPENRFLRGVAMLYLLPLGTLMAGATLAAALWTTPAMSAGAVDLRVGVGALVGLAAGVLALRFFHARDREDPTLHPVITERLSRSQ